MRKWASAAKHTGPARCPVDEAKLALYHSVLASTQMNAVAELRREREGALKRSLLPKYVEKKAAGAK